MLKQKPLKIILGSASKSRRQILRRLGFKFSIKKANLDEKSIRHKNPKRLVLLLANAKADALLTKIKQPALLITADQVVICHKLLLEKPESATEFRSFLELYNKFPATTITAITITNTLTKKRVSAIDAAKVYFKPFSAKKIAATIKREDLYNCAGGFRVETKSGNLNPQIKKIIGEKESIMGLPVKKLLQMINTVARRF